MLGISGNHTPQMCQDVYIQKSNTDRAAERIIGPWGSFNFGPLVYPSLYILCHVRLHESLSFVTKGGGVWGFSPRKNFKIYLKMVQFYAFW